MTGQSDVELSRWTAAFPARLASDVAVAAGFMPTGRVAKPTGSRLSSSSIDSDRHPVGVTVAGEVIVIPSRYYGDELRPSDASPALSPRQRTLLACMFTRHHMGFVRQRWARELVQANESWVVPFVVQLLGEYVVEIIVDLHKGLDALDDPQSVAASIYRGVLLENSGFLQLTRQRVASYWDCYYRGRYLTRADYPAHELLRRFESLVRRPTADHLLASNLPEHRRT